MLLKEWREKMSTAVCMSVHISGKNMDTDRDIKKTCKGCARTK
jgi:hypothetical protein